MRRKLRYLANLLETVARLIRHFSAPTAHCMYATAPLLCLCCFRVTAMITTVDMEWKIEDHSTVLQTFKVPLQQDKLCKQTIASQAYYK